MYELVYKLANEQNKLIYPQVEHMGPGYPWDHPNSITNIKHCEPLESKPSLNSLHLDSKTYLTDLITQSYSYARYLLISGRFLEILDTCAIQPNEIYQATVFYKGKESEYHWVHFNYEVENDINFTESQFCIRRSGKGLEQCDFADKNEMKAVYNQLADEDSGDVLPKKIVFNSIHNFEDLFYLQLTKRWLFVSDRLKTKIDDEDLSGFEIRGNSAEFLFRH